MEWLRAHPYGEQPDFSEILDVLKTAGFCFGVIGGLAMVAQGSNPITQDIGVGYPREQNNDVALARAFANRQPRLRVAGAPFCISCTNDTLID